MNKYILKNRTLKSEITRHVLDELSDIIVYDYHQAINSWWHNIRKSGGLRLTDEGFRVLKTELGLDSWNVDISQNTQKLNHNILLQLDRSLQWPYYIDRKIAKIIFFSSKEATLATLYGDVGEWLSRF